MPRIDGPSYRELQSGDPPWGSVETADSLYGLAAFAYHHADKWPYLFRQAFFVCLKAAWPRPQGDKKESEHRALMAWKMAEAGKSVEEIAETFDVKPDTAQRWIKRTERDIRQPSGPSKPGIEVVWTENGEEPEDPMSPLTYARWMARSPEELERQIEDMRRAGLFPISTATGSED
jgi:hypothetical protein